MKTSHMLGNAQRGIAAEGDVAGFLTKVLFARTFRLEGPADLGRDLFIQFPSVSPLGGAMDLTAQVKSGLSFGKDVGRAWKMQNLDPIRFRQWQRSTSPVALVWIPDPSSSNTAYWKLIRPTSSRTHLYISKRSTITPTMRYDLNILLSNQGQRQGFKYPLPLLDVPLNTGIRTRAKTYYREKLQGRKVQHEVLGSVEFTWAGWRHVTHQRRVPAHIQGSLALLPLVPTLITHGSRVVGLRRLRPNIRGSMYSDQRLVACEYKNIPLQGRSPARIIIVLKETISYPLNWTARTFTPEDVQRRVTFVCVYEKPDV